MTFTEEQILALTDEQLMDYMQNYVWYEVSAEDRLLMGAEYRRRHPDNVVDD